MFPLSRRYALRNAILEYAALRGVSSRHADAAGRSGNAIGRTSARIDRRRFEGQLGFHDYVEAAIRPDQQREVGTFRAAVLPGYVEDTLGVLEERVHSNHLSAG